MFNNLLHIFQNTPYGKETLFQSIYFCKKMNLAVAIYIPKHRSFLMDFENDVVRVNLDDSYFKFPDTALKHAAEIFESKGLKTIFLNPKSSDVSGLIEMPTTFDYMCCPRSISDMSSRIGLGHIGPKIRKMVISARFPILIPSQAYKEWHSIAVFFGGSANAVNALKLGFEISKTSNMPIDVFTLAEKGNQKTCEEVIKNEKLEKQMDRYLRKWYKIENREFGKNLYTVPHDAIVVLGAYEHGIIKEIALGSKMEKIHATLPNSLLIVGPNYNK